MSYIGAAPSGIPLFVPLAVAFSGNGSANSFTLPVGVSNTNQIEVLVNSVQQSPVGDSYTTVGTTLTFTEAPSVGSNNIVVIYRIAVS
jgi:hypothetical protein